MMNLNLEQYLGAFNLGYISSEEAGRAEVSGLLIWYNRSLHHSNLMSFFFLFNLFCFVVGCCCFLLVLVLYNVLLRF